MGPGRGLSGTVPWKCQESQAELPGLFLPGANCLMLQCSAPNKPKVSSIFRGAGLACVSPEGQGRRGHQEASWKEWPKVLQDGQGTRTPWTQPSISPRHQSSRPVVPSQLLEPHTPAAGHPSGLRTDGTWVTHPEMLCVTFMYTVSSAIGA